MRRAAALTMLLLGGCLPPRHEEPGKVRVLETMPAKPGMTFFGGRLSVVGVETKEIPVRYKIRLRNLTRGGLKFAYVVAHFDPSGRRWFRGVREFTPMTLPPGAEGTIEGVSPFRETVTVGLEARPVR